MTSGNVVSYTKKTLWKNIDVHVGIDPSYYCLHLLDCGGFAAKREGRGPGGRLWRHGFADGIWTARVGDAAFEGDHGVGDSVHAHVVDAFDPGDTDFGFRFERAGDYASDRARAEIDPVAGDASIGSGANYDDSDPGRSGKEVASNAEVAKLADALA